jgi:uncharacterized coiled-coil DUF342 family protein
MDRAQRQVDRMSSRIDQIKDETLSKNTRIKELRDEIRNMEAAILDGEREVEEKK